MEATELREKTNELEKSVKLLLTDFIKDVGCCDINIDVKSAFYQSKVDIHKLINLSVKIYVTV